MTWSPGPYKPQMAVFSATVEFGVKQTRAGSAAPNSSATASRQAHTVREAARVRGWAPRPGEPTVCMASTTAWATQGGFKKEVAAASR